VSVTKSVTSYLPAAIYLILVGLVSVEVPGMLPANVHAQLVIAADPCDDKSVKSILSPTPIAVLEALKSAMGGVAA